MKENYFMKKTLKKHLKGVFLAILGLITGILCIILGIKMFLFFEKGLACKINRKFRQEKHKSFS